MDSGCVCSTELLFIYSSSIGYDLLQSSSFDDDELQYPKVACWDTKDTFCAKISLEHSTLLHGTNPYNGSHS